MKPGLYSEMSPREYHGDPCDAPSLSNSIAKVLLSESPRAAWKKHPRLNPDHEEKHSKDFDVGKAMHGYLLEGDAAVTVVPAEDWRTNKAKELRTKIRAEYRIPLNLAEKERVDAAMVSLRAALPTLDVDPPPFTSGKAEQTLIWQEENGIWCRARLDWLRDDHTLIEDLKTTGCAHPGSGPGQFGSNFYGLDYQLQEAFYRRGMQKVFGVDPKFRFVAFEPKEHGILCCGTGPQGKAIGQAQLERAIGLWGVCLEQGYWPGYPDNQVELEPPGWALRKEEEAIEQAAAEECL